MHNNGSVKIRRSSLKQSPHHQKRNDAASALAAVAAAAAVESLSAPAKIPEEMVGSLTVSERKLKVDAYLKKRARQLTNRLEGKTHQYAGRTKFANARRRVKGRFVTLEFMQIRGIKFDSEKPGWVCSSLNDAVFLTADDAVKAVDNNTVLMSTNTTKQWTTNLTVNNSRTAVSPRTASSPRRKPLK